MYVTSFTITEILSDELTSWLGEKDKIRGTGVGSKVAVGIGLGIAVDAAVGDGSGVAASTIVFPGAQAVRNEIDTNTAAKAAQKLRLICFIRPFQKLCLFKSPD